MLRSGGVTLMLIVGTLALAAAPLLSAASAPQQTPLAAPYRVQEGDTLYGIALMYGAGLDDLMALNQIRSALDLRAGATLLIPIPPGQVPALEGAVTTGALCGEAYTVKLGDTLADIAFACGLSASQLASLNGINLQPGLLYPGQVLRLSADTGGRSAGAAATNSPTAASAPPIVSAPTVSAPTATSTPGEPSRLRSAPIRPALVPTLAP